MLSEEATFAYKVDNYYNPECDRGIAFDDENLNIDWKLPIEKMKLSEKDKKQPSFENTEYFDFKNNLYA